MSQQTQPEPAGSEIACRRADLDYFHLAIASGTLDSTDIARYLRLIEKASAWIAGYECATMTEQVQTDRCSYPKEDGTFCGEPAISRTFHWATQDYQSKLTGHMVKETVRWTKYYCRNHAIGVTDTFPIEGARP